MGYTTDFEGSVTVQPPLNAEEIAFLTKFNESRRVHRREGPYFVDAPGFMGQDPTGGEIDHNQPPPGQPGLWCQWVPNADGTKITWDGGEKFYDSPEWMKYIIEHFLQPGALAPMAFLQKNHVLNGVIDAQGEESSDRWQLVVTDNKVSVRQGVVSFESERAV